MNSLSFRKTAFFRRGFALFLIVLTALTGSAWLATGHARNNPLVPQTSVSEQASLALQKFARNQDVFVIYRDEKGESVCRLATPEEKRALSSRGEAGPTRIIYTGGRRPWPDEQNAAAPAATKSGTPLLASAGLRIVLHGTQQLQNNPTARDAFIVAANRWEALVSTPITVILDVDFGTTIFGQPFNDPGILGSTASSLQHAPLSTVRQQLINNAPEAEELQLYNALPASVPVELNGSTTSASQVRLTYSTSRALGLRGDITDPGAVQLGDGDAGIGFNSAHTFDFNPDDGIPTGMLDFDAVVVHEIGHALGFTSASGNGRATPLSIWDLFRFRPGTASLGTMATAPRVMSEGGDQIFFNNRTNTFGTTELGLSTGGSDGQGGDGAQSSHWKDDSLTPFIGIMDPRLRSGRREVLTDNDIRALDTFGYKIGGASPPPPPPPPAPANDNFVAALALNGGSGSITGTNVGATGEPGEPNHAQSTGSGRRSVWYNWTAPANGPTIFNTSGSNYDTVLGIYTGGAVSTLMEIGSNDDVDPAVIVHSSVSFNAVAGTTYRIAVDGFEGDVGEITLNWSDPRFTISGTISSACCDQSTGISNITMTLSGAQSATTLSDAGGFYRFPNLPAGNYTVTPSKPGVVFTPTSTTINNLSQNQTANFTAARLTFQISGQAKDVQNNPIAGATVVMSREVPGSPIGIPSFNTTDAAGNFSFTADPGSNYTVSISKPGYVFLDPRSITFNNLSANQSVTFTARRPTISGRVLDGGSGIIAGATVTLSGAQARVTTTGADGSYSFEDLPPGNYILSPSKPGQFTSFAQSVSNLDRDLQVDLVLIPFITISGRITDISGSGLGTASLIISNSFFARSVNADGSYSMSITPSPGAPITITPVEYGYTFVPASATFDSLSGGNQVVNFPGTLRNPIDASLTFVQQNYQDFLNRPPDPSGVAFWTNNIESCGPSVSCTEVKRIDTSAAFFLSIEFQETGYLVYRLYKAAYGDLSAVIPFPVRRAEFLPDTRTIGNGVVVQQTGWEELLEANTQSFILAFVSRPSFVAAHPGTTTPAAFVNTLFTNAGVTPSATDLQLAIDEFGGAVTSAELASRARALRRVAENPLLKTREFNKAFVLMQYFGYLLRNPDDAPDNNLDGYNFWLNKLNLFNGDFRQAEMVKAFITSGEYRRRFGPP